MATIPVCENGLPVAPAMNRLSGARPRRVRASPSRKTMSPSRSTLRPQRFHRAIAGVMGRGGSSPAKRDRLATGPQKLPDQAGGFIQSVASSAPRSVVASAIIQQQNQNTVGLQVRRREAVPERPAPPRAGAGSEERSTARTGLGEAAEGVLGRSMVQRSSHGSDSGRLRARQRAQRQPQGDPVE